jgi:hypothetical protein
MGNIMSSVVISGDTSGAITLSAPTVAGTNTITLPAATGTVLVSGSQPAFRAYQSTQQTGISNVTATKISLQTKTFDTASAFDATTNYRFTPLVAGYYQVNGAVGIPSTTNNTGLTAIIYKNGSAYSVGASGMGSTGQLYSSSSVSDLIYLNGSTDYLELWVYGAQGSSYSIVASTTQTYFSASLVRAA